MFWGVGNSLGPPQDQKGEKDNQVPAAADSMASLVFLADDSHAYSEYERLRKNPQEQTRQVAKVHLENISALGGWEFVERDLKFEAIDEDIGSTWLFVDIDPAGAQQTAH
eukprot:CAMPEP_0169138586 /NCGR_PEP_ID=MMETSP1015-20121227/42366_1 /TAXON_ID=342587 /ORGANISM="Karlodinium micrum, Strain CCMP2283" /LENGTH=109 /DNA_ID=CAMNT_0009203937 /DNA_START=113 /DNA_END=442 /DNA_ORIENTATION=-